MFHSQTCKKTNLSAVALEVCHLFAPVRICKNNGCHQHPDFNMYRIYNLAKLFSMIRFNSVNFTGLLIAHLSSHMSHESGRYADVARFIKKMSLIQNKMTFGKPTTSSEFFMLLKTHANYVFIAYFSNVYQFVCRFKFMNFQFRF